VGVGGCVHACCKSTDAASDADEYAACLAQPVVKSSFAPTYLTCGRFSPTRPGVVVAARADGSLDIWDLVDRSHEPSLQHNVGPEALTALEFWGDSSLQLLAVGDKQGTLHILEIPRTLRKPLNNEKALVEGLLNREVPFVFLFLSSPLSVTAPSCLRFHRPRARTRVDPPLPVCCRSVSLRACQCDVSLTVLRVVTLGGTSCIHANAHGVSRERTLCQGGRGRGAPAGGLLLPFPSLPPSLPHLTRRGTAKNSP
jgi:hypothetical protein